MVDRRNTFLSAVHGFHLVLTLNMAFAAIQMDGGSTGNHMVAYTFNEPTIYTNMTRADAAVDRGIIDGSKNDAHQNTKRRL